MKVIMLGRCGAYPTAGEATTGLLLQMDSHSILVDCGSGVLERMQRYVSVEALSAVFISHYHHDHVADLGVLQYAAMLTQRRGTRPGPLKAFLPTADKASFDGYRFAPWFETEGITAQSTVQLFGAQVTFLATKHPVPCLAMRFEHAGKVVTFSGDSAYIPELAPFAAGSDVFVCEANFFADEDGSVTQHLTSREVGLIAAEARVGQVVMTHLPADGDHEQLRAEVMEQYKGPVTLSHTGLTIEV